MASYNTYDYRQDRGVNAIRGRGPTGAQEPSAVVSPPSVTTPDTSAPVPAAANPFLANVGEYGLWGVPSVAASGVAQAPAPVNPAAPVTPAASAAVFSAAETYRNLPATATSAERNAAMQNYANVLREDRTLASAAPAPIDRYQAHLARQGISPNTIGTAEINRATGTMNVPSPIEETVAANAVNQANALYGYLKRKEEVARTFRNPEAELAYRTEALDLQRQVGLGKYETALGTALADLRTGGAQRATIEQRRTEMARADRARAAEREAEEEQERASRQTRYASAY